MAQIYKKSIDSKGFEVKISPPTVFIMLILTIATQGMTLYYIWNMSDDLFWQSICLFDAILWHSAIILPKIFQFPKIKHDISLLARQFLKKDIFQVI